MPWYSTLDDAYNTPLIGIQPNQSLKSLQGAPTVSQDSTTQVPTQYPVQPGTYSLTPSPLTEGNRPTPYLKGQNIVKAAPRMENSIEYQVVNEYLQKERSPVAQPIRHMSNCDDFRVHLRNCPGCRDYMRQLLGSEDPQTMPVPSLTSSIKENFANIGNNQMIDLIALVAVGLFIIFVLDCFSRLVK